MRKAKSWLQGALAGDLLRKKIASWQRGAKKKQQDVRGSRTLHFQTQQSQELYQASRTKYPAIQILAPSEVSEEVKDIDASLQFQTSHSLYSSRLVLSACGKIFGPGAFTNRKNWSEWSFGPKHPRYWLTTSRRAFKSPCTLARYKRYLFMVRGGVRTANYVTWYHRHCSFYFKKISAHWLLSIRMRMEMFHKWCYHWHLQKYRLWNLGPSCHPGHLEELLVQPAVSAGC